MTTPMLQRAGRELLERRWITGALALLLLAASLLLGWQSERRESAEQLRQVNVQARILGGSVASALAFDDAATAREHLAALRLNEAILAAAVYDESGRLVASFAKPGEQVPERVVQRGVELGAGQVAIIEPVQEGPLELGFVYLRASIEPLSARLTRYLAIGILLAFAALLIAILGASNAAAVAANRQLQEQIAAREKAENALRQAQKMEALGQLTGGVAHDFNNLLMAASSGLELMGRAKTDERRDQLEAGIRDALQRGARITQQLLAFSRRTPVQSEMVRIDRHIDKLAELLDHSLRENISVKFDIAEGIWPVEVDVAQLDVAILNLAVNAKDAMPKGGTVCITARNRPGALDDGDAVEIGIEDEGVGMTSEEIEKAFEPFFTTKEVGRGTGLGLSQVYGFVRASGGDVSISSEPGAGTKVTMLLPRSSHTGYAAPQEAQDSAGDGLRGLRILLVEDDPNLNVLVSEMLRELGLEVESAECGAQGLELFQTHPFDVALSDMVMPGEMDGLDLARRLREQRADFPVVLMTGYSTAAGPAAAEGLPVLRKPFTMAELTACLEATTGGPPR